MRRIFAALGILGLLSLGVAPTAAANPGDEEDKKIDLCQATGSETNPYVLINVSINALNGHGDRDIIPPNSVLTAGLNWDAAGQAIFNNGCVPVQGPAEPPVEEPVVDKKIDICQATGSATNPYVLINVSINSLKGHTGHGADIIPPNEHLPNGLNWDATGQAIFNNGCVPVQGPAEPPVEEPGAPAVPGQPGAPGAPGQPGQPGAPAVPGQPGQPGQPGAPAVPGEPGKPGMGGVNNQGYNVQTAAGGVDPAGESASPFLLGGFVTSLVIAVLWASRRNEVRS